MFEVTRIWARQTFLEIYMVFVIYLREDRTILLAHFEINLSRPNFTSVITNTTLYYSTGDIRFCVLCFENIEI